MQGCHLLGKNRIKIASAMAAMAIKRRSNTINFAGKFKLYTSLLAPPSSPRAVRHGPCLLTLRKRPRLPRPSAFRKLLLITLLAHTAANDWLQSKINFLVGEARSTSLSAKQDQLLCGPTGTLSGNCRETETRMVRACHAPRQPPQNHPSGHLGGRATSWSAEEIGMDNVKERKSQHIAELLTVASCTKN